MSVRFYRIYIIVLTCNLVTEDYSRPHVVPFGVAIPNVNFPPGTGRSGFSSYLGSVHEAGSQHHYLYIAVVTFAGGRIVKVPAGFTTFLPTPADLPPATPFVSNITFKEDNCNQGIDWPSMQLPVFRAQATLEGGNVVRQGHSSISLWHINQASDSFYLFSGDRVKGRVVIDRMTSGSSTVQSISASFRSERDDRWAKAQATSGGDTTTFTSGTCFPSSFEERSYSCHHSFIFRDDNGCGTRGILDPAFVSFPRVNTLNEEKPYLDFELNVGENMVRDFRTYYATYETYLQIELGILYAPDVGHCMFGEMDGEPLIDDTDDMDLVEEGLWDDGTPVGMAKRSQRLGPSNYLVAKIPITLLGAHHPAALPTSSAPIHYLTPGVASPLILTPPFPPIEHIKFPQSQPVIIHVPVDNIIQRLPLSASATEGVWNSIVDPNRNYYSMPYTGLLWRKKIEHADRTGPVAGEEGKERQVNFSI